MLSLFFLHFSETTHYPGCYPHLPIHFKGTLNESVVIRRISIKKSSLVTQREEDGENVCFCLRSEKFTTNGMDSKFEAAMFMNSLVFYGLAAKVIDAKVSLNAASFESCGTSCKTATSEPSC